MVKMTGILKYEPRTMMKAWANEAITEGDIVRMRSDGKLEKADDSEQADAVALTTCTTAQVTAGDQASYIAGFTSGRIGLPSGHGLTIGAEVSPDDGTVGEVKAAAAGTQVVGMVLANDKALIHIQKQVIPVA